MISYKVAQIKKAVPQAALYEQLAEECSELAQASLKKARKLRNENYTPKTMSEIDENLIEEYTDLILTAEICDLSIKYSLKCDKIDRWVKRLNDHRVSSLFRNSDHDDTTYN